MGKVRLARTNTCGTVLTFPAIPAQITAEVYLGVHVARHLEELRQRGLSRETIYQRHRNLIRLYGALRMPLCDATAADLAAWRAALKVGDDTVAAYVSHVREFYAWLEAAGILCPSPAAALIVPKLGRRIPRPIGEALLYEAVQAAPARIRPMLVLAAWAGLRAKEIALLRRSAVLDTAQPPVILVAIDATKGRRERIVPMSQFVLEQVVPDLPRSGWCFRMLDDVTPMNANYVSALCNRFLHSAGIGESLHQLRHRFGSQAYQASLDLRAVQELMGHAHPQSTAGYAAFNNANAIAAVEGIPAPGRLRAVSE